MRSKAESAYDCIYNLDKKGTADNPIEITSYEGEKVTLDRKSVV